MRIVEFICDLCLRDYVTEMCMNRDEKNPLGVPGYENCAICGELTNKTISSKIESSTPKQTLDEYDAKIQKIRVQHIAYERETINLIRENKDKWKKFRDLFLKYLTEDSETQDARRREFNQAIFFPLDDKHFAGRQVFNDTTLDMVMEKFDKAVKEFDGASRKKEAH